MILTLRCPCCHGSQFRTSHFDVSERNPYGAKCIFCKSVMIAGIRNDFRNNPATVCHGHTR
ncbi:cold-shock protein [Enterobacteriaceae bacterium BIT-l23]|uniref:Cold-shock protein n=1 Tax=Jejubacter calystegiae TaxID=2579935 RepID=A0A4P8YJF1_9ENTR|nr:cold-shock protein [Jejubacter calystegiae]NUU64557.1 cold-shock protein [Enterobacteriaceae bacterium BIT-l23]QCT20066.1 cold-shock protein [Jejubacter calystegiae]